MEAKWNSAPAPSLARFDFTADKLGRRVTAKQSGTAFADYYNGTAYTSIYNAYTYNARSELETAAMYRGTPPTSGAPTSADELPARRFEYRYDGIGNRKTAGSTGQANTADDEYTTNALNQYTAKENNTVKVLGTAAASATVAVGSAPSTVKKDRAWGADLVPPNNYNAVQGTATVYAAQPGAGSGGTDLIRTDFKNFFIPPAAQTHTYDADGNLTSDAVWLYTYNAENMLVRMRSSLPTGAGFTRLQIDFKYDYMGRRIQKSVFNLDTSALVERRYLYDGWNLLAEFALNSQLSTLNLVRSYTWGLDLTGDLTRAGGVGALVQIYDYTASKTYLPTYDGNGNVVALVNSATGGYAALYEYDPYDNYLRAETFDAAIADNPFRFSTKFTDSETGLVYYGLRYYSPSLGRFVNRDPIEERGGLNLYGFAGNDSVNRWDRLGLCEIWKWTGTTGGKITSISYTWEDCGPTIIEGREPPREHERGGGPSADPSPPTAPTGPNNTDHDKKCAELAGQLQNVDAALGRVQSAINSTTNEALGAAEMANDPIFGGMDPASAFSRSASLTNSNITAARITAAEVARNGNAFATGVANAAGQFSSVGQTLGLANGAFNIYASETNRLDGNYGVAAGQFVLGTAGIAINSARLLQMSWGAAASPYLTFASVGAVDIQAGMNLYYGNLDVKASFNAVDRLMNTNINLMTSRREIRQALAENKCP